MFDVELLRKLLGLPKPETPRAYRNLSATFDRRAVRSKLAKARTRLVVWSRNSEGRSAGGLRRSMPGPRVRIPLAPAASHERTVGRAAARCSSAPCASRSVLIIPAEGCSGPNGNLLQSSTCVPNSTTLFGGIWKYSHALTALRVITPYPQNLGMNRLKTVPMLATHAALSACRKKAAAARLGVDQP